MKIHRFIGDFDLAKKEVEIKNPENIKQIKDVLRLEKGEKIILSDGEGEEAEVTLDLFSADKITGIVNKVNKSASGSSAVKKVNLYLAILKKENFELAVQKAVECGVSGITPIITERTIKTGLNITRLEKIILEACEQSGRNVVPVLSPILNFENALAFGSANKEKIIFTPPSVGDVSSEIDPYIPNKDIKSASIFVGPEGGFTEKEIKLAENAGYTVASLGKLTLRGETAAIIATYRTVKGI